MLFSAPHECESAMNRKLRRMHLQFAVRVPANSPMMNARCPQPAGRKNAVYCAASGVTDGGIRGVYPRAARSADPGAIPPHALHGESVVYRRLVAGSLPPTSLTLVEKQDEAGPSRLSAPA
jgi:hypothetical protein